VCRTEINANKPAYLCAPCEKTLAAHDRTCEKCGCSVGLHAFVCERCKNKKNKRSTPRGQADWHFTRAHSPFNYDGAVVDLVLRLKYSAEGDVARFVAPHLADVVRANGIKADLVVPVPLSANRAKERGYNQAGVLAEELSKLIGVAVAGDVLVRVRDTVAQKKMTLVERQANLKDAFKLTPIGRETIKGKRVLLVDDVLTTGTTADECARTLKSAKPTSVQVLTVASVGQMC